MAGHVCAVARNCLDPAASNVTLAFTIRPAVPPCIDYVIIIIIIRTGLKFMSHEFYYDVT